MKTIAFIAALLLASLGVYEPGASQAGPPPSSGPHRVFAWLRDASSQLQPEGYQVYRIPEGGVLRTGQVATMQLPLQGGREYQIMGMCDEACANLDLALYDPAASLLDRDNAQDDVPFISARPAQSGIHWLQVTMRGCAAQACFFAVTVVVK